MTTPTHCLECNAPLSSADTGGVCPKCLLRLGLASQLASGAPGLAGAGFGRDGRIEQPFDFGGYRILRLLGKGGMGAVYEAEQQASGRRVALKVLGTALDSPEMRARFLREGRLAAALNHPNSVFIYGTEEIEGAPVIAMELVAGGTLKDELKRRGPLPVRDAVDAILQVIAGLEAAAASGVLHRDVKPGNCFVASDGTVKVGDFGLSVSTLARHDTQLTASGMMLGTPSFAPPEQLRGDELDSRADIYSVGATLYALLTGRAPFDGDNAVQVVAAVLDKAPVPLAQFRADLPAGLADVVLRCLAKDRAQRFADYAALREALLPFSSALPEPAPPAVRFAAGLVDEVVAMLPAVLALVFSGIVEEDLWLRQRTWPSFFVWLGFLFVHIAYYAIPEGRWGASLGKALFRLRVMTPSGAVPGFARAALRALIFVLAFQGTEILTACISDAESYRAAAKAGEMIVPWWMMFVFLAIPFLTMRRRNGFASMGDLASGTRVVLRPAASARRGAPVPAEAAAVVACGAEKIGPFRVTDAAAGGGFITASDDALRRAVWIRRLPAGGPALPAERRELSRATRLRWLQGARTATEAWDAFEAPAGRPFAAVIAEGAPAWADMRHWLLDLTEELDAAAKDGTLPAALSLAHVWITSTGRAVLFDEPWKRDAASRPNAALSPEQLLAAVAATVARRTLPVHARQLLDNFASGALDRLSFLAGNLRSLLTRSVVLDWRRRLLSFIATPFAGAMMILMITLLIGHERGFADRQWAALFPGRPPLSLVLRMHIASSDTLGFYALRWPENESLDAAVARHIADRYAADMGGAHGLLSGQRMDLPLDEEERTLVAMLMARFPRPDAAALAEAEATLSAALQTYRVAEEKWAWWFALHLFSLFIGILAIVQAIFILGFRSTPGQRMFGFAVLNAAGEPAGRGRLLWRWIAGWTPFFVLIIGLVMYQFAGDSTGMMTPVFLGLGSLLLGAGFVVATVRPQRGLHDVLAGTWLVPR